MKHKTVSDQNQSTLLRQLAINDGLRNKPIKQMIIDKDQEIEDLKKTTSGFEYMLMDRDLEIARLRCALAQACDDIAKKDERIQSMTAMLDGVMAVFQTYLNVPESRDLRERWIELRNELVNRQTQ